MSGTERSVDMILAAYFMAKFGESGDDGRERPPAEMGADTWAEAYRRLYARIGDGRSFKTFQGSINQDRRHYLECLAGTKSDTAERRAILGQWASATRADLWERIRPLMS